LRTVSIPGEAILPNLNPSQSFDQWQGECHWRNTKLFRKLSSKEMIFPKRCGSDLDPGKRVAFSTPVVAKKPPL
jgi:hypothetical protein